MGVRRYNALLILLGMVRPMQVDGVWDRKGLLYNPYMANMLTRRQYYLLQWLLRTDVVSLLEDCRANGTIGTRGSRSGLPWSRRAWHCRFSMGAMIWSHTSSSV